MATRAGKPAGFEPVREVSVRRVSVGSTRGSRGVYEVSEGLTRSLRGVYERFPKGIHRDLRGVYERSTRDLRGICKGSNLADLAARDTRFSYLIHSGSYSYNFFLTKIVDFLR